MPSIEALSSAPARKGCTGSEGTRGGIEVQGFGGKRQFGPPPPPVTPLTHFPPIDLKALTQGAKCPPCSPRDDAIRHLGGRCPGQGAAEAGQVPYYSASR
ncbi:hypothetical protein GDO81_023455 [Engystomops pustulosus]|uniref:Uncharacterized protein n=1 Tax=Engystomops pustulosus TaxID=76066 RepID=A0AAV6YVK6_ENGPU|nr:hypothetical protein GDO81_023455 [Engystomops pustulosus]